MFSSWWGRSSQTTQQRKSRSARLRLETLESRLVPTTLPTGFVEVTAAQSLSSPTAIQIAPDGNLFITEQAGTMEIWNNGTKLRDNFFLNTPLSTDPTGERGLLGVAFDPAFASNRFVYVYYTTTLADRRNRVSRFTADAQGLTALANSETIIWEGDGHSATNHNGGAIHFGPDGKLYIATGDNANGATAQSLTSLHGKILRINPDGSIPSDNPFFNSTTGKFRSIWALGLRNPFTFAFQPGSSRMFVNDVGQVTWEEINVGAAGANYGWPSAEGPSGTNPTTPGTPTRPLYSYNHNTGTPTGNAITGGTFYNPTSNTFGSAYTGDYFFTDVVAGWIYRLDFNPTTNTYSTTPQAFASGLSAPVNLVVDSQGSLYYASRGENRVYKILPSSAPVITQQPTNQIATLGQSATFSATASGTQLSYQWQRADSATPTIWANITGATSNTLTLATTTLSDNNDLFRLVVRNPGHQIISNTVRLSVTQNQAPVLALTADSGLRNGKFDAGTAIAFSGTANDPEDGPLGATSFTWRVDYLTTINGGDVDGDGLPGLTRPFVQPFSGVGGGTFTPAVEGPYTLTDVAYAITMTATDSQGLRSTRRLILSPNTVTITINSDPLGAALTVDSQPSSNPRSFASVVGFQRSIGAANTFTAGVVSYAFASWSNNGTQTQAILTPTVDTTYTASYSATAITGTLRYEAERLQRTNYIVQQNTSATGGALAAISAATGSLAGTFQGPTGFYQVLVYHFDENDGAAQLAVNLNGTEFHRWTLNRNRGSNVADVRSRVVQYAGITQLSQRTAFEIAGVRNGGELARVDSIDFLPITAAPPAPTARAISRNNGVKLTWTTAPMVTSSYNVYRGTSSGALSLLAQNVTGSSFTDTTANNGTRYFYQVTAVNPIGESVRSAEVSAVPTLLVRAINAGGLASGSFEADNSFSGPRLLRGSVNRPIDTSAVSNPGAQEVYQSQRAGDFRVTIGNLAAGETYLVRLHFVELNPNVRPGPSGRAFHVNINGQRVLTSFDILAAAGARDKAITREFRVSALSMGALLLDFQTVRGNAVLNGLEIFNDA
jgi:glucose/arabinose dehydrogenase